MTRLVKRWLTLGAVMVIGACTLGATALAQQANVDAGKKEGKVIVYGSVVPQAMDGLHQGFKKKYGIDVEYWRGSST